MQTLQLLFGPVGPEVLIIVALLVLLFGADRVPKIANSVGKSMGSVTKERKEIEAEFSEAREEVTEVTQETKEEFNEVQKDLTEPLEETKQEFNEAQTGPTDPTQKTDEETGGTVEQPETTANSTTD